MRITITVEAANDAAAHSWLDRIVHRIEDGWHVWDLTDLAEPASMEATSWFRDPGRQGQRLRELLRELLRTSIRREAWSPSLATHGRRLRVTPHPAAEGESKPEDAFRLADKPLVLLVENRQSDGSFLRRVVGELDRTLGKLWKKDGEPIRVDSVGGSGQMQQEVQRRAEKSARPCRLVVVVDSDREGPEAPPSSVARKLGGVCEEHGVPCWILAKREAENYLPRALLEARPDTGPADAERVEAWDRLDEDQKDFFDMKDGLSNQPSATEESAFRGISPADRQILSEGFGEQLHTCWCLGGTAEVRRELIARSRGDLERGLEMIRSQV